MADWETFASAGQRIGPAEAQIKIVEFSDFQCPFCARARTSLREVQERYPGRTALIYRHLPLEEIHPYAFTAALASECAGAQGRFEQYHDLLFDQQALIGTKDWAEFAEAAGVADVAMFRRCVATEQFRHRVEEDIAAAKRLNATGTPAFLIGSQLVSGALSLEEWDSRIQNLLAGN